VNVDMITGEVIPDMGVHGVFDVLYELGSGGSGRTFLCRCVDCAVSCCCKRSSSGRPCIWSVL
jgi:hypothetical protein